MTHNFKPLLQRNRWQNSCKAVASDRNSETMSSLFLAVKRVGVDERV
jgi:hypothetical protein